MAPNSNVIHRAKKKRAHEHHASAAATLNRYCASRDAQQRRQNQNRNFLYNNNFHNQSFTAINSQQVLQRSSGEEQGLPTPPPT